MMAHLGAGRPPIWLPAENAWGWRRKHFRCTAICLTSYWWVADDIRKRRAFRKSLRLLRLRKYIADDADAAAWNAAARLLQRWMRWRYLAPLSDGKEVAELVPLRPMHDYYAEPVRERGSKRLQQGQM